MLKEFLKKEFSEENILFWQACEFFSHVPENDNKQVACYYPMTHIHPGFFFSNNEGWSYVLITSLNFCWPFFQLSQRAREIYNTFLSSKATTPVNIDSQAQLADDILNAPKPNMFKEQQLQVVY